MPMILAMNGVDEFGDFGAAKSQPIADLQTALVALGKGIKDGVLMKIVVDGLIGPKTTAAVNRALTVHLGPGQAPSNLRTGLLSQTLVVSQAGTITDLIEAEIARRGFTVPVSKKIATTTTRPKVTAAPPPAAVVTYTPPPVATAPSPVYRVPTAPSGPDMNAIIKWSAIGVGVVAIAGIAYWAMTRKAPAMAGFAGEGEHGHPFRRLNNAERENWINNDEGLYRWFRGSRLPMRKFIQQNRAEIDAAINSVLNREPER